MTLTHLLLLSGALAAAGQAQQPDHVWSTTVSDPGTIIVSAWSPTDNCVAVATDTAVHVIDRDGRPLWTWAFRETNRFLHPHDALAVSPACDAVVVGGWSDYKYVWMADRNGKRAFFNTVGTPLHAKFDLLGTTVAVTTAAPRGYLLSTRLELRWSGALGDLPVRWPSQPVNASNRAAVSFQRDDVAELVDVLWGQGRGDSVSDDGQWRVAWSAPYRGGDGEGVLELWGPGAGGFTGRYSTGNRRARWTKPLGCPEATIASDGMFVIATGDPDRPRYEGGRGAPCERADVRASTYVFDRDGNMVLTWPQDGSQDEMAKAVLARTGVALTVRSQPSWDIPLTPEEVSMAPNVYRRFAYSHNGRALLITRDREIRMYRAPR